MIKSIKADQSLVCKIEDFFQSTVLSPVSQQDLLRHLVRELVFDPVNRITDRSMEALMARLEERRGGNSNSVPPQSSFSLSCKSFFRLNNCPPTPHGLLSLPRSPVWTYAEIG